MKDLAEALSLFVDKGFISTREAVRLFKDAIISSFNKD